jgi:hypothetical protein
MEQSSVYRRERFTDLNRFKEGKNDRLCTNKVPREYP